MTLMQRRRTLMWAKKARLPAEYQEVEYIQSSGTQAIITSYWLKQATNIYCEFEYVPAHDEGYPPTFGYPQTFGCISPSLGFGRAEDTRNPVYVSFGNKVDKRIETVPSLRDAFHTVTMTSTKTEIDGTYSVSYNATVTENSDRKIALFSSMSSNNTLERFSSRKIRVFQIKENDVLVLDLVPCYRKAGNEIGMYDLVSNTFLTNAGTGTFTKGANV